MNTVLRLIAFESLRYATMAWDRVLNLWDAFWDWYFWTYKATIKD